MMPRLLPVRFHDLRHTSASRTLLREAGARGTARLQDAPRLPLQWMPILI